jgi:hypothetical protein
VYEGRPPSAARLQFDTVGPGPGRHRIPGEGQILGADGAAGRQGDDQAQDGGPALPEAAPHGSTRTGFPLPLVMAS